MKPFSLTEKCGSWNPPLTIFHKVFAVLVLIPTFGNIDWSVEEIHFLGIKTRKILASIENLHRNRDIDKGGRSLRSILKDFKYRVVSLRQQKN